MQTPLEREDATRGDALLCAVAGGDRVAFAELYDLSAELIHGTVLKVVGDPAQAERIAQEVALEVWRTAPSFDPARGSATTWIASLAGYRAIIHVLSGPSASVGYPAGSVLARARERMSTVRDGLARRRDAVPTSVHPT